MVRFREPGNKKPRIRFRVRGFRYFRQDLLVRRTPSARTSGDNKDEYECYEGKCYERPSHIGLLSEEFPRRLTDGTVLRERRRRARRHGSPVNP